MRGKVAKRLRRQAEAATVGQKPRAYQAAGRKLVRGEVYATHVALDPTCTRALYRWLKRKHKEARHA